MSILLNLKNSLKYLSKDNESQDKPCLYLIIRRNTITVLSYIKILCKSAKSLSGETADNKIIYGNYDNYEIEYG